MPVEVAVAKSDFKPNGAFDDTSNPVRQVAQVSDIIGSVLNH
jgi:hypothetical protein